MVFIKRGGLSERGGLLLPILGAVASFGSGLVAYRSFLVAQAISSL